MTELSENLKKCREEMKVSQYKLAEDLNIKRSAYGNYETGMSYPEYETLEKIADYLKVNVDYLLGYDESFDKSIDLLAESKEVKRQIRNYFYKKYRKVPSEDLIKKIISKCN